MNRKDICFKVFAIIIVECIILFFLSGRPLIKNQGPAETFTPAPAPTEKIEETIAPTPTTKPTDTPAPTMDVISSFAYEGPVLNAYIGTVQGPSGKETYYNLPMGGVIEIMRNMGFSEEEWPYWEREDGCKMLGDYIMCAANLDMHPRGSLVESSLGTCIVCDTGEFALYNESQLDIAVNW